MSVYNISMPEDKDKKYQQWVYPAGEQQVRLLDTEIDAVEAASKIVLTARTTDIVSLMLMLDALLSHTHGRDNHLILPYLPYGRADRAFTKGDCHALNTTAFALSSAQVVTFDVHNERIFKRAYSLCGATNISPLPIIKQVISLHTVRPTLVMPDKGARTRYDYTTFGDSPVVECDKIRDPVNGKLTGFTVPNIPTQQALIIDDICDGGGTFIGIAEQLQKQQPEVRCNLYVSHGIFSQGFDKLRKCFDFIYTTDSFPGPRDSMVRSFPVDGLLKAAVMNVEELFEQVKL